LDEEVDAVLHLVQDADAEEGEGKAEDVHGGSCWER